MGSLLIFEPIESLSLRVESHSSRRRVRLLNKQSDSSLSGACIWLHTLPDHILGAGVYVTSSRSNIDNFREVTV